MSKPRLLDLFCKAGGASMGYYRAGFRVVGVDRVPQKNYPFRFHCADALAYLAAHGHEYDAIAASPPCQHFSVATRARPGLAETHPDLVAPVRELLIVSGKPYVIENVVGAPLLDPITLCGVMFPGLRVYRHRLFESNVALDQPQHPPHDDNCQDQNTISRRGFIGVYGGGGHVGYKRQAMGIAWMTRDELSQAIPPAYTEWIGRQLIAHLHDKKEA